MRPNAPTRASAKVMSPTTAIAKGQRGFPYFERPMPRTYVAPALLNALFGLLCAERERVVYAQQNFDYKGTKTWADGLNPYVTDPDRFMHIPEKWDGTVVVLGYGITYLSDAGTMELECLTTSSASSVKAVKIWFPNSAITDFSPECSYNAASNKRATPGGLARLHGSPGAENEKRFLQNNLEFVKAGGKLILLTNAVKVEPSTVWEGAVGEVNGHVFQLCHPCVYAKNVVVANAYYRSKIPLLRNMVAMVHSLPVPDDDDLMHESAVNIIIARGVAVFNAGGRPAYQDPRQPDQAALLLPKEVQQVKKEEEQQVKKQAKKRAPYKQQAVNPSTPTDPSFYPLCGRGVGAHRPLRSPQLPLHTPTQCASGGGTESGTPKRGKDPQATAQSLLRTDEAEALLHFFF